MKNRCVFLQYSLEFFITNNKLWRKDDHGKHKLVIPPDHQLQLLKDAYDSLGHKGIFSICTHLLDWLWWLHLDHDMKWYIQSCHQCQVHQMCYHHIPPPVTTPASLFRKAYIDTMFMPQSSGYWYIVQARCSLSAYPEFQMLCHETGSTIGTFLFEDLLCHWGALKEIVTDNGKPFIEALDYLAMRYGIQHICISSYNSQANGPIERCHLDVREAIMKSCDGDKKNWHTITHSLFWAEQVTTHKNLGYSSYYITHGVEPLFPFNFAEATYMVLTQDTMSTTDLIAIRAHQLCKRDTDFNWVKEKLTKSRLASTRQFEEKYANTIKTFDFEPGNLVLIRN
jgi:Integrase zinc binding domain